MRFTIITVAVLVLSTVASAQSGRRKPSPTPTPKAITGPSVKNLPTQTITPAPTPKPKAAAKDESDEIIKVDSVLVPIPVSVLDSKGKAVTDLRLADFELKIDGKVVDIGDIARSDTPIRMAMLFDNSSSVLLARDFEQEAAVRFFRRVIRPEKDRSALFSVAAITHLEQPITSDVGLLTQAIEMLPPPEGATALLDGIITVAEYLRSTSGRRVIVIVSDGEDTISDSTLEAVLKSLQINNCQVFVVKTTDFENYKRTGSRVGNANIRRLDAERRMGEITRQTGGMVFSPIDEKEMNAAFDRISAELSQQYVLSYYPNDEAEKVAEFREISLSVKGKQNLTIRARKGYYVGRIGGAKK